MNENENNKLITPESTNEPGTNFDGILNNAPPVLPVPVPAIPPLDKVKEMPRKRRSRELGR